MQQSCAGNMIWRQAKQRMARVKLHIYIFFHLKIVKIKKVFVILVMKQRTQKNVSSHYPNIPEDY